MKTTQLLRFSGSVKRASAIETWMEALSGELGVLARHWFEVMRAQGGDVRELLHDGHPTACIGDAAVAAQKLKQTAGALKKWTDLQLHR